MFLTFLSLAVVGVSPEPVVELLLVAVEAGAAPGQAVHLAGHVGVLHVAALGVEVGHVPAILLVIVVVGVGAENKIIFYLEFVGGILKIQKNISSYPNIHSYRILHNTYYQPKC